MDGRAVTYYTMSLRVKKDIGDMTGEARCLVSALARAAPRPRAMARARPTLVGPARSACSIKRERARARYACEGGRPGTPRLACLLVMPRALMPAVGRSGSCVSSRGVSVGLVWRFGHWIGG